MPSHWPTRRCRRRGPRRPARAHPAAVLRSLDTGRTTTALADPLRVSPSAASRHATTLRRAGLVDTERRGGAVLRSRTALGTALVHGTPERGGPRPRRACAPRRKGPAAAGTRPSVPC
ncbi:transcriptional regulator [Streptomyces sp. RKND-216]|nr:transcriptional regulator [Streptomyces sp. RKND-216]